LRWTSKSAAKLARALGERGYEVSDRTVLRLLKRLGYCLQANQKTRRERITPTATRSSRTSTIQSLVRSSMASW